MTKQTRRPKGQRAKVKAGDQYSRVACDLDILHYLAKYRYLRSPFLYSLCSRWSKAWVIERLAVLHKFKFIAVHDQLEDEYNLGWNYSLKWEITPKGYELLDEHVPQVTSLERVRHDMPRVDHRHTMMICDTLASIEVGVQQAGLKLITQEEIVAKSTAEYPMKLKATIRHKGHVHEDYLIPDAVFRIPYPDKGQWQFALEAQHKSPKNVTDLTRSSTIKKLLGFKDIDDRKGFKQLGRSKTHILMVYPTEGRMKGAIELAEQLYGKSELFLFQVQHVPRHAYNCPKPRPELYSGVWYRAGLDPIALKDLPYEHDTIKEDQ